MRHGQTDSFSDEMIQKNVECKRWYHKISNAEILTKIRQKTNIMQKDREKLKVVWTYTHNVRSVAVQNYGIIIGW